ALFFEGRVAWVGGISKTFLPARDAGVFAVSMELPPGTNMNATTEVAKKVDEVIRGNKEISSSVMFIGGQQAEGNIATFYVQLVPSKERQLNTSQVKERVRGQLKPFAHAKP